MAHQPRSTGGFPTGCSGTVLPCKSSAKRIGETAFDLVVVSISVTGSSPQTFPALKSSSGGPKIVLCYMSIGQAEEYRSYWQPEWTVITRQIDCQRVLSNQKQESSGNLGTPVCSIHLGIFKMS